MDPHRGDERAVSRREVQVDAGTESTVDAAESADTSMSALLRRSAMIAATGRPLDRNARLDIAAIRTAANALQAAIDDMNAEPVNVTDRLR